MLALRKSNNIIINMMLVAAIIAACINIAIQLKCLLVGRGLYFGYDTTVEWKLLVIVFWLFWLIGSVGLLLEKKVSFVFLFPASVLSIVVILSSLKHVIYKGGYIQIYYYSGLLISCIILIYLNIGRVREKLSLSKYHYVLGTSMLIIIAVLFFLVDERQHP